SLFEDIVDSLNYSNKYNLNLGRFSGSELTEFLHISMYVSEIFDWLHSISNNHAWLKIDCFLVGNKNILDLSNHHKIIIQKLFYQKYNNISIYLKSDIIHLLSFVHGLDYKRVTATRNEYKYQLDTWELASRSSDLLGNVSILCLI
ncbi:hypothetical protein MXB_2378, partial [Myxobolus squamalis]